MVDNLVIQYRTYDWGACGIPRNWERNYRNTMEKTYLSDSQ